MTLSSRQKKYIKKNVKRLSLKQIAQNLNISEGEVTDYLKKHWDANKYQNLLKKATTNNLSSLNLKLNLNWKIFLFLSIIVIFAYANSLGNNFVSDDIYAIVENKDIGDFSKILRDSSNSIRPFSHLIYFITYKIGGLNPIFFRSMNILFHLGNLLLVYTLLSIVTKPKVAFFTSLIFAIHPILTESVTWIGGGSYPQYSLFFLISILAYILSTKNTKFYFASILSFLLSLSINEKAISLPFVLLVYEISFGNLRQNWKKLVPFFVINIFWVFLLTLGIGRRIAEVETMGYEKSKMLNPLIQIPIAITSYLELIFYPISLTLYHSEMVFSFFQYVLRLGIFLVFLGIIVFSFFKNRFAFFWLSFFFITLLPTLTPFGIAWIVAERYVYLGSLGIFVVIAFFLEKLANIERLKIPVYIIFTFIIIALITRTIIRNIDWQNEDNLWLATGKTSPSSPNTHNNLGDVYGRRGDKKKALEEFKKAIELRPNYADAYHNLANTYKELGEINQAIDSYQKAISFNPVLWQSYQNLAAIYFEKGQYDLAEKNIKKAISVNPKELNLVNILGIVYFKEGFKDKAKEQFLKVLAIDPNNNIAKQGLLELTK